MFLLEEFDHLRIQLEDIVSATDNFGSNKLIGRGGFGPVYKGELPHSEGRTVAFKRLDPKLGQGNTEFWKEIMMLSKVKHENLISLLQFCFEGDERILVYEYASRGSLDRYLSDASLTWIQRLKICVQTARAINYLHDPKETQQRVIHRDLKSSNILLDENWEAKVSDFGLSKIGLANQTQTYVVSNVVGTFGYCDPLYHETGFLSKESDVYSFGVVLFEVMCGKLCCEYRNNQLLGILVPTWKKHFVEKRLDDIIFEALKGQIDEDCLMMFSTIAYRCLNRDHKERPTMVEIVYELEVALNVQEKADGLCKSDDRKGSKPSPKRILKAKIAEITEEGGLVDVDGVKELIQLMSQLEIGDKNINVACRTMLLNVILSTNRFYCLDGFLKLQGLRILEGWISDFNEVYRTDKSVEEFLFALLGALDKLPVNLDDLQTSRIARCVIHLPNHKSPKIYNKARSIVDGWMKVDRRMKNVV